jgi:hypothetical protein
MVQTIRHQTNIQILMKRFFKTYIDGNRLLVFYCKKAGLGRNTVYTWKKEQYKPSTFELICLVQAVAKHQKLNFDDLIIEAFDEVVNG